MSMLDYDDDGRAPRGAHPGAYGSDADMPPDDQLGWDDEEDFVTVRSGGHRVVRAVVAVVLLGVIVLVLYKGISSWFDRQLDPEGEPGETVAVVIPAGATTRGIASQLESQGIIPNGTFFRYYTDWKGEGNFQAGEYQMQLNSSADEAIAVLNGGPAKQEYNSFLVPEGRWVSEMLPAIAEQLPNITVEDLQAALNSGEIQPSYRPEGVTSWEGLLFPAKYEVEDDATALDVLRMMSDQFQQVASAEGYGGTETRGSLSAYEVIIIASMVEAEAKTDEDRPKIARVIYNRLQNQQSFDIDATCIYAAGDRQIELTNDYMNNGAGEYACRGYNKLPPTPISAPGQKSLEAAINPAEGEWLYYVLKDTEGNHLFTDDYDEFINQKNLSIEQGIF